MRVCVCVCMHACTRAHVWMCEMRVYGCIGVFVSVSASVYVSVSVAVFVFSCVCATMLMVLANLQKKSIKVTFRCCV